MVGAAVVGAAVVVGASVVVTVGPATSPPVVVVVLSGSVVDGVSQGVPSGLVVTPGSPQVGSSQGVPSGLVVTPGSPQVGLFAGGAVWVGGDAGIAAGGCVAGGAVWVGGDAGVAAGGCVAGGAVWVGGDAGVAAGRPAHVTVETEGDLVGEHALGCAIAREVGAVMGTNGNDGGREHGGSQRTDPFGEHELVWDITGRLRCRNDAAVGGEELDFVLLGRLYDSTRVGIRPGSGRRNGDFTGRQRHSNGGGAISSSDDELLTGEVDGDAGRLGRSLCVHGWQEGCGRHHDPDQCSKSRHHSKTYAHQHTTSFRMMPTLTIAHFRVAGV